MIFQHRTNPHIPIHIPLGCVWFGNEVECNVMVPFHRNGLVPFRCLIKGIRRNGMVPSQRLVGIARNEFFHIMHLVYLKSLHRNGGSFTYVYTWSQLYLFTFYQFLSSTCKKLVKRQNWLNQGGKALTNMHTFLASNYSNFQRPFHLYLHFCSIINWYNLKRIYGSYRKKNSHCFLFTWRVCHLEFSMNASGKNLQAWTKKNLTASIRNMLSLAWTHLS